MKSLILSAGLGTRLRPLTDVLAKPAVPFLNLPMLGYSLFNAAQVGPKEIWLNTHYLAKTVEQAAHTVARAAKTLRPQSQLNLKFSHEEPEVLGRGGALKKLEAELSDDFVLLLNGDSINLFADPQSIAKMFRQHQSSSAIATIMITPFVGDRGDSGAIWIDDSGRVKDIGKKSDQKKWKPFRYPGVLVLNGEVIREMQNGVSDIFYDTLIAKIREGAEVQTFFNKEMVFFETGNEREFLAANKSCLQILNNSKNPYYSHLHDTLDYFSIKYVIETLNDHIMYRAEDSRFSGKLSGFLVLGPQTSIYTKNSIGNVVHLKSGQFEYNDMIQNKIIF